MSCCVLLVEDDELFARPLRRTLESAGYAVVWAASAAEARACLAADGLALVVTDTGLSEMDGLALTRLIKDVSPDLPVIVMTARGSSEAAAVAMDIGAEGYLVKPFEAGELLMAMRRALELGALRVELRRGG